MSKLTELLARVQAAKGPDRGVDHVVAAAIDGDEMKSRPWSPNYTGSLDALAAFAERVLPGYNIESGFRRREGSAWAIVWPDDGDRDDDYHAGKAATEPLARLAAILAAKIEMEGTANG